MNTRPELSFDGCGINGPDEYRTRLFTARPEDRDSEAVKKYGPLCAAAPEMLAALNVALLELEANKAAMQGPEWAAQRTATGGAIAQVARAIYKAEGRA